MAGGANLLDLKEHAVLVAVKRNAFDFLHMPARFALLPKALSRTAPIVRIARFQRLLKGLFVHICLHEHVAALCVLRDGADEPALVEFDIHLILHADGDAALREIAFEISHVDDAEMEEMLYDEEIKGQELEVNSNFEIIIKNENTKG